MMKSHVYVCLYHVVQYSVLLLVNNIHVTVALLTLGVHVQQGLYIVVVVYVCLLTHISPLERLFILKILSCSYSGGNGGPKKCGLFSETSLLRRSGTPSVESHTYSWPFSCGKSTCALPRAMNILNMVAPGVLSFSAFPFNRWRYAVADSS